MQETRPADPIDRAAEIPHAASASVTSLWHELADGSAGAAVKIAISIAMAPLFAGVALLLSYALAASVSGWNRNYGDNSVRPKEEMVACVLGLFGLLYLAALAWIWTRNRRRHRTLWGAGLLTIGIAAATILASAMIDSAVSGDEEVPIGGVVLLAFAGTILVWVQAARKYARPLPMHDPQDGTLDVRCPSCGYRMVGLHESRCPECGTEYTLDELLSRQDFITRQIRRDGQNQRRQPPPVPAASPNPASA